LRSFARRISSRLRWLGAFLVVSISLPCSCSAQPAAVARAAAGVPPFDATNLREPADLDSVWLVHAGDDPAYARADFDDSQWTPFDPHTSITDLYPNGCPELVWYRMRVKVDPRQTGLALRELSISRAFEVYVNGERLIASGQIAPFVPYTLNARILKRIPDRLLAPGSLLIAIRVHISRSESLNGLYPGYYAYNLALGQESTLDKEDWLAVIGENALGWLDKFLLLGLGIVALALYAAQRNQTEYLWIFALAMVRLAQVPTQVISCFYDIPIWWQILASSLQVASPFLYVSMYFAFVQQRIGWRFRIFLVVAGVLNALSGLEGLIGVWPAMSQFVINLPFVVLLSVVIPIVLAVHLRRGNREAGILLIPVILFSLYIYAQIALGTLFEFPASRDAALRGLNLINRYPAGPFSISLDILSGILSSISLAIIMLLRSTRMSRQQAQLEGEVAAAREVQQVILPEQAEAVPGFKVESIYQPAQQVGGDFFQVLPAGEGGLLVFVGDVAGKGLPAAMLVSVLVGAIRGIAEYTQDPAELLANLNERLIGRAGGGFSTALVAHITADGRVSISNAGHLSPYLDGVEIDLPGALPLGIQADASYDTIHFYLTPGSRLTFYSDGVVEAQNQKGELFGFERGRAISTQPAAAIVEAAQQFGQFDDITVVTIERAAVFATAA
jgi:hypothetical protein